MNVYMISSPYDGCSYYRIFLPAWHNGFETTKSSIMDKRDTMPDMRDKLVRADVVVFHRPEEKEFEDLADKLIADGKKIVFDNDDTFKFDDNDVHPLADFKPDATEAILEKRNIATDNFIKKSHLVTTTTEFLKKEYSKLNDNVIILPNCIDPDDWDEPLKSNGPVRIGMVGSVSYEYDYLHLKPLLKKLGDRDDVQLVLFGLGNYAHRKQNPKVTKAFKDEYDFWDSVNKEQIPWCPNHEYIDKLREARLDIMLIPRKVNYFNKCKSNIKFLEAAMMEVPVIAQSYEDGPYEELEGREMGILVKDNKDWEEDINNLIEDKKLRETLGKNAKEYTLANYNIKDQAHKWHSAYYKLCVK